jgi:hypothetical protein
MPKIKPTRKFVAPDAYEKEFGDSFGQPVPKKKIKPSRRTIHPDAFEKEFGPKPKSKSRPKKEIVGEVLQHMKDKVLNTKTGRWVKKTSRIGKKILALGQ